jgi:methyl-accepting chemotaxis protein
LHRLKNNPTFTPDNNINNKHDSAIYIHSFTNYGELSITSGENSGNFREVSRSSGEVSGSYREVSGNSGGVSKTYREVSKIFREISKNSGEVSKISGDSIIDFIKTNI